MIPKFYKCNLGHFVFYKFVVPTTFTFKEEKGKTTINKLQPIMMHSHLMNIQIIYRKTIDKEATKQIRKQKEWEEKKTWCVTKSFSTTKKTTQKLIEKCARTNFNLLWSKIAKGKEQFSPSFCSKFASPCSIVQRCEPWFYILFYF